MAQMQNCEACGAAVYPEHVDQGRAGRWAGQLLCAVCYAEKRSGAAEPVESASPEPSSAKSGLDEPISLVDVEESDAATSKIRAFSQHVGDAGLRQKEFRRQTAVTGHGACRVRTFHSKLQAESIEFMDNAINEWLDEHPEIEIKFVTTTIGTMAGKHPEPNLILSVWY